jgi:membrane protease YdiL (CAAX protease family)
MAYIFMGFIIATLIIGGGFCLLLKMGEIKIQRVHFLDKMTLIYNIVLYIIVALTEEIAFRGYILGRLLRTNMHGIWALIISAIVFMLMHGANNHITMLPMFNLFLAGVLLGSVYIYTKNLWYGISLHFFWNFLQGPIFGFSVSGIDTPSIFKIKHSANILINGGEFGFEGSLLCSVLCIVVIAVTILIMNRTHKRTHLNDTCIEG